MLSEGGKSFTNLYETLEITSSHLNYHLESLGELVSKDNGSYRLSVFGKAAVDMMQNIESPPRLGVIGLEQNRWRMITGILLISIVVISGISAGYYKQNMALLNEMKESTIEIDNEIRKSESLTSLFQLVTDSWLDKPITIVNQRELSYMYTRDFDFLSRVHMDDLGKSVMVFYSPLNNTKLRLYVAHFRLPDHMFQPITVQKGNAFNNESSVLVREMMIGDRIWREWQSEIIWEVNSTGGGDYYEVSLPDRGWYTLSIAGSIKYRKEESTSLGYMWGYRDMWKEVEGFSTNIVCKIYKDEKNINFGVEERTIFDYWYWSFDEQSN